MFVLTRTRTEQFPLAVYLCRLTNPMERRGFAPNDRLQKARTARDATSSLMTELHYLSCNGVGHEKSE